MTVEEKEPEGEVLMGTNGDVLRPPGNDTLCAVYDDP